MAILPTNFTAGTTLNKAVSLMAYLPPEWTLSLVLRGPSAIDIQAEQYVSTHRLMVSANTTKSWLAGTYWYSARVSNGIDVIEVETGELTVVADLSSATSGYDGRNHLEKVIDAIEAVLEKRATQDQQRYTINNRELWRTPILELLELRDRYKSELRRAKAKKRGDLFNQAVKVRFR